jgi:hypothetical protein
VPDCSSPGSLLIAGEGQRSIIVLVVAVILLDVAIQGVNILNQTRLFAIDPLARSRLSSRSSHRTSSAARSARRSQGSSGSTAGGQPS